MRHSKHFGAIKRNTDLPEVEFFGSHLIPGPNGKGACEVYDQERILTAEERDYVDPRVERIDELERQLSASRSGGALVNRSAKEKNLLRRDLLDLMADRHLKLATYQDNKGEERRIRIDLTPSGANLIIE